MSPQDPREREVVQLQFDLFCSLAQTPRGDHVPGHEVLMREFLEQAVLADQLGLGCIWVAESHFSLSTQQSHRVPVMPYWKGEMGLNSDICQLAAQVYARTEHIEVGSAIMNIVAGGPIAAAERVAACLAWHGLRSEENRRLNVGFASGRFDHVNQTLGVAPRNDVEATAWKQIKGAVLQEAGEVFVRLLTEGSISSEEVQVARLPRAAFSDPDLWEALRQQPGAVLDEVDTVGLPRRWEFEQTALVPNFRPELLSLYAGTHVPALQKHFNQFAPVRVFNLSITQPAVIEETHDRMAEAYHSSGGPWRRSYMPRTVFVFVNADPRLSPQSQREAARARADEALGAYWTAMDGTLDPERQRQSAANAVIGTPRDVAFQLHQRFHPDDRLMLWFDFFRPSGDAVLTEMTTFVEQVQPLLDEMTTEVAR